MLEQVTGPPPAPELDPADDADPELVLDTVVLDTLVLDTLVLLVAPLAFVELVEACVAATVLPPAPPA